MEQIIVALIGAAATIAATVITVIFSRHHDRGNQELAGNLTPGVARDRSPVDYHDSPVADEMGGKRATTLSDQRDRQRKALLIPRLKQLVRIHEEINANRPQLSVSKLLIRAVLIVLAVICFIGAIMSFGHGARDAVLSGAVFMVVMVVPNSVYWTLVAIKRHKHRLRENQLETLIAKISDQFPDVIRSWGGISVLEDEETVKDVIANMREPMSS